MGTRQIGAKNPPAARWKPAGMMLALLVLIVAAGFAGPKRQVCEEIARGKSPEGAERVTVRCVKPRWAFHFPPKLW